MMMYVKIENGKAVRAATAEELAAEYDEIYSKRARRRDGWQDRNDWRELGYDGVCRIAAELSAATGRLYLGTDAGPHVSPRYDVVEAPRVGDKVSRSFNGDSYPCGDVVSISASGRVITARESDGSLRKFYRRRQTGSWIQSGGTWSLIGGHVSERNPSF